MKLVIAALAAATTLSALPATAAVTDARPAGSRIAKAAIKASATTVTEGDRVTLRARIPKAGDAKRVVLQERYVSVFGDVSWMDLASKRAKRLVSFPQTVTARNQATYRVAVTYRERTRPMVSKPLHLTVWRWIELREFTPYFQTGSSTYGQANMNGAAYAVWGGYAGTAIRAWEARVTPGRNCTRFRAVLGLADTSDDGSTGTISFAVDETTTIYSSPTLTPGMTLPVELDLARPYRFGMSAANTSADKVKAYPMVGNGAFYCTGIED
ncbi:MAG TPA: hypothetical protein VFY76_19400 [Nocardioides sp.]|nr:hypothetical protein [Nocardioides sp.]